MRILHVTDFYQPRLGGIEVQVAQLAQRQLEAGHTVAVVTCTAASAQAADADRVHDGDSDGDGDSEGEGRRAGAVDALQVHRRPGWALRPGLRGAAPLVLDDRVVVHAHLGGLCPFTFSAIAARARRGLPTVVTVHSVLDTRLMLMHRGIGLVSAWNGAPIVWQGVSLPVVRQLRRLLGRSATVRTVPNGVDQGYWTPVPVPGRRRDEVVVVAALRHARRKRVEALPRILDDAQRHVLSACSRSSTPPPTMRAVIVGEGRRTPALGRALRGRGLTGWVELPGRLSQDELRRLYHACDVFVAPTVLESFGLAAVEARFAGLPVVARHGSGTAELIEGAVDGLVVRSDAAMAEAVAQLVLDPALRRRMHSHNAGTPLPVSWSDVLASTERSYCDALALAGLAPTVQEHPAQARPVQGRPAQEHPAPASRGG